MTLFTGVGYSNQPLVSNRIAGASRWNATTNMFEMFDGKNWVTVTQGHPQPLTLDQMVEQTEDVIATTIENEYADNVTVQDAFKEWEKANERFRIILAISEKK
jgi:hypothetical protein